MFRWLQTFLSLLLLCDVESTWEEILTPDGFASVFIPSSVHKSLHTCLNDLEQMREENQLLQNRNSKLSKINALLRQQLQSKMSIPVAPREQTLGAKLDVTLPPLISITETTSPREPLTPSMQQQTRRSPIASVRSQSAPAIVQSAHSLVTNSTTISKDKHSALGFGNKSESAEANADESSGAISKIFAITDSNVHLESDPNMHCQPLDESAISSVYQEKIPDVILPPLLPITDLPFSGEHLIVSSARLSRVPALSLHPLKSKKYRSSSAPSTLYNVPYYHLPVNTSQIPMKNTSKKEKSTNSEDSLVVSRICNQSKILNTTHVQIPVTLSGKVIFAESARRSEPLTPIPYNGTSEIPIVLSHPANESRKKKNKKMKIIPSEEDEEKLLAAYRAKAPPIQRRLVVLIRSFGVHKQRGFPILPKHPDFPQYDRVVERSLSLSYLTSAVLDFLEFSDYCYASMFLNLF